MAFMGSHDLFEFLLFSKGLDGGLYNETVKESISGWGSQDQEQVLKKST